ncbi:MAG: ABC transporter ATP-binding protein [Alphaproteobacteria bacterium]|nr:ABC transporter ATP-binding protein [Alphaproteobacteria bacterium]
MSAALRLRDLTVAYERHPAIHHVSLDVAEGALTAVVGPNGAGKSTLLKAVIGEVGRVEGSVDLAGRSRAKIAYLPQISDVDRSFPISVLEVVLLGKWARIGGFGGASAKDRHDAIHAIEAVGLRGFEQRPISTLSAGQFQRVLFARVLLQDAEIILLDEPFNAIDARTTADLMDLVQRWHADCRTVLCVLHDLDQARTRFPDAILLARELVAAGPTAETLSAANLLRARAMAEAWDEDADACLRAAD